MDGQIDYLSRRSDECEKDRLSLHRDNAALREQLESLRASRQTTRAKVA
jgi:cell division protein FtsB